MTRNILVLVLVLFSVCLLAEDKPLCTSREAAIFARCVFGNTKSIYFCQKTLRHCKFNKIETKYTKEEEKFLKNTTYLRSR